MSESESEENAAMDIDERVDFFGINDLVERIKSTILQNQMQREVITNQDTHLFKISS